MFQHCSRIVPSLSSAADNDRWRIISMVFALPVAGFLIINLMNEHEHIEPPPDYPYLKMANRVS